MTSRFPVRRASAFAIAAVLPLSALAVVGGATSHAAPSPSPAGAFHRLATYPVFQNVPSGVDPAAPTVAEISDVSDDGTLVAYTDALGKRVGLLDITDPAHPKGRGSIDLALGGDADDQPTSVAIRGQHLLVVVDTSGGAFTSPSGRVDVYDLATRTKVRSIDLGGQPDSITVSADEKYAAIAIENQRNEDVKPTGGAKGDLPQLPAGFVQILDLTGAPAAWGTRTVALTNPDGSALPAFTAAGLDTPVDPEPEYVALNAANKLALTLQENNGIVIIDVPTGAVEKVFSAGSATVTGVDTTKDGLFNPTGTVSAPREPDAIAWVGTDKVATANEGDWKGGTRGWTIFDTTTGAVVWDAGNTFEQIATRHGLHNNDRAAKKGAEPEGISVVEIGGKRRAFVGSERSNFVAVYDLTDPSAPRFEQVLPTTNGPEGLLPVPARNLLVVSSETDDAAKLVRASVGVYGWSSGSPSFPSVVSADRTDLPGQPIGWGALGALSAKPGDSDRVYAASDSAYKTGRIYTVDTSRTPALIESVAEVTDSTGATAAVDIEGLAARAEGGFWVAHEGATGAGNKLLRLDEQARIVEEVPLPSEVTDHIGKWGLEGVTTTGRGTEEKVWVALQRPQFTNPADVGAGQPDGEGVTRIGRYDVAAGTWSWFGYQLDATQRPGDWLGLSEITTVTTRPDGSATLAVIERDKQNGTTATVKRIQTVEVPAGPGAAMGAPVQVLPKKLALDVLPALRAQNGWTQEKLEGLTITGGQQVLAVTDNDGLVDATGETQLLRLGTAAQVFASARASRTTLTGPVTVTLPGTTTKKWVKSSKKVTVRTKVKNKKYRKGAQGQRGRKFIWVKKRTTKVSWKLVTVSTTWAPAQSTLTAAVPGVSGGTLTVRRGGSSLAVAPLPGSGTTTVPVRFTRAGTEQFTAAWSGTAERAASTSPSLRVTVVRGTPKVVIANKRR